MGEIRPETLEKACDAAFPGLPSGMSMGEARRRVAAAAPIIAAAAVSERDREWQARFEELIVELKWDQDVLCCDGNPGPPNFCGCRGLTYADVVRHAFLDGSFAPGATTGGVSESTAEKGEN